MRCPLQFYFERVAKLSRPFAASGMVLGSAVHEGLAIYHRQLQVHLEPASTVIKEQFVNAWDAAEAERPIQYRDGEKRGDLLEQGVALLETYMAEAPPQNILAVEEPMTVPLHNSTGEFLEKPLIAIVDLLSREERSGLTVTEFKTSGRRYNEFEADTTLQATCYAHAVQEKYDESPAVKYTVLVKTKKPTIQHLETVRSNADLGRLGDVVQSVDRAIDAKAFYPVENPMNCSGCPYRLPCRDWKGISGSEQELLQISHSHEVAAC